MVLFRTNYQGYRIEIVNDLVGDGFIGVAGEALSDEYSVQRVRVEGESLPYVLWNVIDAVDRGF
mgnify:CR=1 FL=1